MEDDLLALLDRSDRGTDFLHDPRVFVPQGVRQGHLYLFLPNALHDMEIGMAHSGPRHPDDDVRRILQTWSLDIHELERFVVGEKSGRIMSSKPSSHIQARSAKGGHLTFLPLTRTGRVRSRSRSGPGCTRSGSQALSSSGPPDGPPSPPPQVRRRDR